VITIADAERRIARQAPGFSQLGNLLSEGS